MQTYAVVDCDFRFVKIGRTTDLEARLTALNTASPRDLILMAVADGDIELSMHKALSDHRERLEWFRYNEKTESLIIVRMTPTPQWHAARKKERRRRRKQDAAVQLGPLPVAKLSNAQRDSASGVNEFAVTDELQQVYGIPSENTLFAILRRGRKDELMAARRLLGTLGIRVREETARISTEIPPSTKRLTQAAFALAVVKTWKRRVGMQLGIHYRQES